MKKQFIYTAIALLPILTSSCNLFMPENQNLTENAVGLYDYTAFYYSQRQDIIIDFRSDERKTADSERTGTLQIEAAENNKKLKITLNNHNISLLTSELESDALINPTGSFSFTIPKQAINGATITGITAGISPDNEQWEGSGGVMNDFTDGHLHFEIIFGVEYKTADNKTQFIRIEAKKQEAYTPPQ